jgi:hypothetical protein
MCKKKGALETVSALHRGPVGGPAGEFVYRGLWETAQEHSIKGATPSTGTLWGELRGRGSLLGTPTVWSYQHPETGSKTDFGRYSDRRPDSYSLTGHNQGLLLASVLDITPKEDNFT